MYYLAQNSHVTYLLNLWHEISQKHAELIRQMLVGQLDPMAYADLTAKVLELWKELAPYDSNLADWSQQFIDPATTLDQDVKWLNQAILDLAHSLKRLGITEFREV